MAEIWELSGQEFKIIIVNMLIVLMEKVNNTQEELGYISREMETLKKESKRKC